MPRALQHTGTYISLVTQRLLEEGDGAVGAEVEVTTAPFTPGTTCRWHWSMSLLFLALQAAIGSLNTSAEGTSVAGLCP